MQRDVTFHGFFSDENGVRNIFSTVIPIRLLFLGFIHGINTHDFTKIKSITYKFGVLLRFSIFVKKTQHIKRTRVAEKFGKMSFVEIK